MANACEALSLSNFHCFNLIVFLMSKFVYIGHYRLVLRSVGVGI